MQIPLVEWAFVMDEKLARLRKIGFTLAGKWELRDDKLSAFLKKSCRDKFNVLYAFVAGGRLMYLGKTVKPLAKRMAGYESGHKSQLTNKRNHEKLCLCLGKGESVDIYVLPDNGLLHYGEFHINLAAGLEDNLIKNLSPPWNGGQKETENETLVPTLPVTSND